MLDDLVQDSFVYPADYKEPKKYIPIYQVTLVRDGSVKTNDKNLTTPRQAFEILKDYFGDTDREHFVIILLNTKNKIIGINTVSIGSLSASIVHPRELFKSAMLCNAASVVLSHNHPSGDPAPSQEDLEITRRLIDAGKVLGIDIRDHIIVGDDIFFSFREKGLI